MRPLKPQLRTEPSLTRAEPATGRTEPALTRADLPRDPAVVAAPRAAQEPSLTRAPAAAAPARHPYGAEAAPAAWPQTPQAAAHEPLYAAPPVSVAPRFAGLSAPAVRATPRYDDVLPAAPAGAPAAAVAAPAFSRLYKAAPPVRREPSVAAAAPARSGALGAAPNVPQPEAADHAANYAAPSVPAPSRRQAAAPVRPQADAAPARPAPAEAVPVRAADAPAEAAAPRRRLGIPLSWLGGGSRKPVLARSQPADGAPLTGDSTEAAVPGYSHQAALDWVSQPSAPAPGTAALQPDPGAGETARTLQPWHAEPAAPVPPLSFADDSRAPEDSASGLDAFAAAPARAHPAATMAGPGIAARRAAAAAPVQPAPVYGEFSPESLIASPPVRRASGAEAEHWSPVLPGHAAQPVQRQGRGFSPAAEAASRPWRAEYSFSLNPPAQDLPPPLAEAADDDEDVPFRPWVDPDPRAGLRPDAVPASTGSAILPADRLVSRPVAAPTDAWGAVAPETLWPAASPAQPVSGLSPDPGARRVTAVASPAYARLASADQAGPWRPVADAGRDPADQASEPGWDRFYADSETDSRPVVPQGLAAAEIVPEAPMMEARPSRRDAARRDPAPSRTAYRLQRMWLTPFYRALLRKGLPAFAVVFACGLVLQDQERRDAIVAWAGDLRASVAERPEFMLSELKVEGASGETADAVLRALALPLPVSSFDLDLPVLQQQVETIPAVASAALHVRSGGVLEVAVQERQPVVVWRSDTGIGTLDATGHQVALLANRLERPDLPLVVGAGAETSVPEALRLYQAAGPIRDRLRGLIRVGERRWDLIVEPSVRIMLPAADPVPALEQVVALHQAQALLDRDITAVDLRNPARVTVRMGDAAAETWRLNLAAQKGK